MKQKHLPGGTETILLGKDEPSILKMTRMMLERKGYTANVIAYQGVLDDGMAFIQKPFSIVDLTETVREVLDKASDKDQG